MTATAHALVAGAIVAKFPDPALAIPLAFTSHFIMDAVPHWDIGTNWRSRAKSTTGVFAVAETLIGITVSYFLFSGKVSNLWLTLTLLASLLPDWLETPWYIFFANANKHKPGRDAGLMEKLTYRIYKTENVFHSKTQLPWGIVTQIVVVAFFFVLLLK